MSEPWLYLQVAIGDRLSRLDALLEPHQPKTLIWSTDRLQEISDAPLCLSGAGSFAAYAKALLGETNSTFSFSLIDCPGGSLLTTLLTLLVLGLLAPRPIAAAHIASFLAALPRRVELCDLTISMVAIHPLEIEFDEYQLKIPLFSSLLFLEPGLIFM